MEQRLRTCCAAGPASSRLSRANTEGSTMCCTAFPKPYQRVAFWTSEHVTLSCTQCLSCFSTFIARTWYYMRSCACRCCEGRATDLIPCIHGLILHSCVEHVLFVTICSLLGCYTCNFCSAALQLPAGASACTTFWACSATCVVSPPTWWVKHCLDGRLLCFMHVCSLRVAENLGCTATREGRVCVQQHSVILVCMRACRCHVPAETG